MGPMKFETVHGTRERMFAPEELFFSTTDRKGFIRASNSVFVRISGYDAEELLGKPHNIIRHPDMPRVVFRLLWDHLEAGEGLAAYVKNRAKDGSFYWVLAAVRPVKGGYLSVRMKPSSPYFALMPSIYAELLGIEQEIEAAGGTRTAAMDAAGERLGQILSANGFCSYAAFIDRALMAEVGARRRMLGRHGAARTSRDHHDIDLTAAMPLPAKLERLTDYLDSELTLVEKYVEANDEMAQAASTLASFANQGSILAFNAELAGGRLGDDGRGLKAVADLMQDVYPPIVRDSAALLQLIHGARNRLGTAGFKIAVASLQNDIARSFVGETYASDPPEGTRRTALLLSCLKEDLYAVEATLDEIAKDLRSVERHATELRSQLELLSAIERNGRIEAARTTGAEAFGTLLDGLRERAGEALGEAERVVRVMSTCHLRQRTAQRRGIHDELDRLTLVPASSIPGGA